MKRAVALAAVLVASAVGLRAQSDAEAELTKLLREFLAGASRNDAAVHDRFWSDDLVYTGSSGLRRVGKPEILRDVRNAPAPRPGDPATTYGAEEIRIRQYGDTAVVAFRLTGATERGGKTEVASYLNTGTFLRKDGIWRAVAWQATRVPRSADETKIQVAAAYAALRDALASADAKALEAILDEGFAWTGAGEPVTRARLLERAAAGRPMEPKLSATDASVSVRGDAGVVRGASSTLTFVNDGGEWKALALHTSRP